MRLRQILFFGLGLAAAVVAAEIGLQLLPVSTATMRGYHHDRDVLTYPSHHRWQVATGWDLRNAQRLEANNWGFAADREFVPDPRAVALIGDSYVEASMLPAADRPAAQLERLLPSGRPVYALGSPGTALLDHAQRIRLASQHFQVRDFVVLLERSDARQSLCGSGNVHAHCLDPQTLQRRIVREPPPGWLKTVARHSALAQYVGGQIKLRPRALVRAMFTRTTPEDGVSKAARAARPAPSAAEIAQMRRMVDAVVDAFFADALPHVKGRLVVAVDGRREPTDGPADILELERAHLIERLRAGGAVVHDLERAYALHASRSARRLEVGPYDGHLNALGVGVAMAPVAASIPP